MRGENLASKFENEPKKLECLVNYFGARRGGGIGR